MLFRYILLLHNIICVYISGDLIILIAQVVQAVQVVIEEKFVSGKDIHPLQAVGWEGEFYGLLFYIFNS